ncbi:MAG: hypothetical protein WDA65_02040 [Christensenellales bacterium]
MNLHIIWGESHVTGTPGQDCVLKGGAGIHHSLGQTITPTSNLTLYAKWSNVLGYWESDADSIGRWNSTPSVYKKKLNSNVSFYFMTGESHARTQWNGAGISTTTTTDKDTANIRVYGGSYNELISEESWVDMAPDDTGYAISNFVYEKDYYYNGSIKTGNIYVAARIAIRDRGATVDEYCKTSTHELGHTLGWEGHANGSSNIMYRYASSVTTLTDVDKRHLQQVY